MNDALTISTLVAAAAGLAGTTTAWLRARRDAKHHARHAQATEERLKKLQHAHMLHEVELRNLVENRLPKQVQVWGHLARGVIVPGLTTTELSGTVIDKLHAQVLDAIRETSDAARYHIRGSSRQAIKNLLDDPQTLLVRAQHAITAELERHSSAPPAFIESFMRIDHRVTRTLHIFQRLRVLSGTWPGIQRATAPIADIVEAARARIEPYQDVHYFYETATGQQWVAARYVEPITIALAELMDNATGYSTRRVDVTVQEVANGYAIVVDDRGVGMNIYQREEANRLMSLNEPLDVTNLTDTFQLGFPIVGRLTGDYGFQVEVTGPSGFGGTRAVVLIPNHMIMPPPDESGRVEFSPEKAANPPHPPAAAQRYEAERLAAEAAARAAQPTPLAPLTSTGLPKRKRGSLPPEEPTGIPIRNSTDYLDPDTVSRGLANITQAMQQAEADIARENTTTTDPGDTHD